jgi:hypothetical protein
VGHWSTYSRRGGGRSTAAALIFITDANIIPTDTVTAQYSGNISAAAFTPNTFLSQPIGISPDSVSQLSASQLQLNFGDSIVGDTDLVYSGAVPGILTPQTISY